MNKAKSLNKSELNDLLITDEDLDWVFDRTASISPRVSFTQQIRLSLSKQLESEVISLKNVLPKILHYFLLTVPTIRVVLAVAIIQLTNIFFISRSKSPLLIAGFGLGGSWLNILGYSMLICFFNGFISLASHAYGAKNYTLTGIYYQRVQVIGLFVVMISTCIMFSSERIFIAMGIPLAVAQHAGTFCRWSSPSLLFTLAYDSTRYFLNAHKIYDISAVVATYFPIIHIVCVFFFVEVLQLQIIGLAMARNCSFSTQIFIVLHLMRRRGIMNGPTWVPWSKEAFQDWWVFLKKTIPAGSTEYMKWVTIEILIVLTGLFKNERIMAAQCSVFLLGYFFFMFSIGNGITINALVSNAVGQNRKQLAINYIHIMLYYLVILVFLMQIAAFFLKDFLSYHFSTDEEMQKYFKIIFALNIHAYFILDVFQNGLQNSLRALGKQDSTFKINLIGFFCIGTPLGAILAFACNWGVIGLWMGLFIGQFYVIYQMFKELFRIDYDKQFIEIQKMLELQLQQIQINMGNFEVINKNDQQSKFNQEEDVFEEAIAKNMNQEISAI